MLISAFVVQGDIETPPLLFPPRPPPPALVIRASRRFHLQYSRMFISAQFLLQEVEDDYGGFMVQVMSGGEVEFAGEFSATGLENMRSVFYNDVDGSIE